MSEMTGVSQMPYGQSASGAAAQATILPGQQQMPPRQAPKKKPIDQIHLDELLEIVTERNASDLHIAVGIPPIIRVDGQLFPTPYETCQPLDVQTMMYAILTD